MSVEVGGVLLVALRDRRCEIGKKSSARLPDSPDHAAVGHGEAAPLCPERGVPDVEDRGEPGRRRVLHLLVERGPVVRDVIGVREISGGRHPAGIDDGVVPMHPDPGERGPGPRRVLERLQPAPPERLGLQEAGLQGKRMPSGAGAGGGEQGNRRDKRCDGHEATPPQHSSTSRPVELYKLHTSDLTILGSTTPVEGHGRRVPCRTRENRRGTRRLQGSIW